MPYAPRATLDNPYGPQVSFRTEDVLPPAAYYLSPEDRVSVWVITDVLAQTVFLQLRLLMPTGEIKLIPYDFVPQSTFAWYLGFEVPPWEGYLLGAMCWSSNPARGQCFVSVQVMRSAPPNLQTAGIVLLQGYINSINVLSYPTSQLESTSSGRGAFLTFTPANITGAEWVVTVPPLTLWRVCALHFTFTTSAAAGTRTVGVTHFDAAGVQLGFWYSSYGHPPSMPGFYSFAPGNTELNIGPLVMIGGPTDLYLAPQCSIQSSVEGIDAGDSFTGIALQVEQWLGG